VRDRYRVVARHLPLIVRGLAGLGANGSSDLRPEALAQCIGDCTVRAFTPTADGCEFELAMVRSTHGIACAEIISGCERLGLYAAEIVITEMLRPATASALAGALGGLGIGYRTRNALVATASGTIAATLAKLLVDRFDIPIATIFGSRTPDGAWTFTRTGPFAVDRTSRAP
jgi:hypothetical protein